jgi:hypothetical protein
LSDDWWAFELTTSIIPLLADPFLLRALNIIKISGCTVNSGLIHKAYYIFKNCPNQTKGLLKFGSSINIKISLIGTVVFPFYWVELDEIASKTKLEGAEAETHHHNMLPK